MAEPAPARAAIVDYGLGNLFSIRNAFQQVGIPAEITASSEEIEDANVVVLPGVGAFGDAMESLERLDLVAPLRDIAQSGRPLVAICLGMQLLMTESYEFGRHRGLGIIEGPVVRFDGSRAVSAAGRGTACRAPTGLKVPQVGWNRIFQPAASPVALGHSPVSPREREGQRGVLDPWADTPLEGLADGEFMYFVHSFYARPQDSSVVLSVSRYGDTEFCSSLRYGNIFACQFHPERSGPQGLHIYRNIAALARRSLLLRSAPHG